MSDARHSGGVQTFGCGRAKYQGLPQSAKSIHGNPELALLKQWISIHNADSDKPGISAPPPQAVCSPPECRAVFRLPQKQLALRFLSHLNYAIDVRLLHVILPVISHRPCFSQNVH